MHVREFIPLPTVTWLASIQNTKVVNKGNEPRYKAHKVIIMLFVEVIHRTTFHTFICI